MLALKHSQFNITPEEIYCGISDFLLDLQWHIIRVCFFFFLLLELYQTSFVLLQCVQI